MVTLRKEKKKKIYIYIYIYTYVYQKCVDFYVVQCSVRRSGAQYVLRWGKNKESILSSLQACLVITLPSGDFSLIVFPLMRE